MKSNKQFSLHDSSIHKETIKILIIFISIFIVFSISLGCYAIEPNKSREIQTKEKLQKILEADEFSDALKEYQKPKSFLDALKEMLTQVKDKFISYLERIKLPGNNLKGHMQSDEAIIALEIIGITLVFIFMCGILYFVFRNTRFISRIRQKEDALLLTKFKDTSETEQKALEYASKGEYRQAFRFLYLALLIRFNELNLVRIDKSKTNKQYLNEVINSGYSQYKLVADFTRDFNNYWYGNVEIGKDKFEFWYEKYSYLLREADV